MVAKRQILLVFSTKCTFFLDFVKVFNFMLKHIKGCFIIHNFMNMKYIIYLTVLVTLFACKNENKQADNQHANNEIQEKQLEVYDYNGLEKYLHIIDNKTYVVNFWATWCVPCVKELPYFEQLNKEYKDKNVEVILVSLDFPKQYDSKLKPFLEKHQVKSRVMALNDTDMNTWIPKVDENWSGAIPATIIYNKEKRQFYEKSFTLEELKQEVQQFIN